MRRSTIVRLFVGSLLGLGAAVVLFFVAGALAFWSGAFVMDGPDVVGLRPSVFGGTMIALAVIALLAMVAAGVAQFVAWIGAVLNTARLEDKTWFVVLLVLELLSLGFPAMIAYVIGGPDGAPAAAPAVDDTGSSRVSRVSMAAK